MSDNEDLLGDDLGDQSLADYNLGNEEEEQLLADDYENGSQNVPTSISMPYREPIDMRPPDFPGHVMEYNQPMPYQAMVEAECVVPNITVEVPNAPIIERPTYAPYEPMPYETEHAVPPAMPAVPMELPQIVPSDVNAPISNGDLGGPRERFLSERPPGAQRLPQIRDIPDSLDKVVIPRSMPGRGRTSWRSPHYSARHHYSHPYRRNNIHRGNYNMRASFPPPQIRPTPQIRTPPPQIRTPPPQIRPEQRPEIRLEMHPGHHPEIRPDIHPEVRPDMRDVRPDIHPDIRPDVCPDIHLDTRSEIRRDIHHDMHADMRPDMRSDIHPDMRPDIRSDIHPDMRPDIRSDIHSNMRPDIRSDIHPDMRPDMRSNIHPEMRPDIHPNMRSDIHPDMRPDMRSDIHPDMRPDMRSDIHPDMRPDMRSDIHPDMRPDMRSDIHPDMRPDMRSDVRPDMRPDLRSDIHPDMRRDMRSDIHPDMRPDIRPDMGRDVRPEIRTDPPRMDSEISPERLVLPQDMPLYRPQMEHPFPNYRFQYRPMEERHFRPNFEPRPFFRPNFPRQFGPMREIVPNTSHLPQVTIRQVLPMNVDKMGKVGAGVEPEVRMLPVALPPSLPPGGLAGKKVLINPHFKGNFQSPLDGPVKDVDDAAERFIAEQRTALARAAVRKYNRRSPQRYIENTTIEIENDLAHGLPRRNSEDDDLSRRQEEFINANRAGLRRRMRSPSPPSAARRSLSPRRSPERRPERRADPPRGNDEETEYKRRLREQENLRERVLLAKEVRRRKNAVALHKQLMEKEREAQEKVKEPPKQDEVKTEPSATDKPTSTMPENKPDTTRITPEKPAVVVKPEKIRERSPLRKEEMVEVNSTCENLTPPRRPSGPAPAPSPERALTPPLPPRTDSDDDLDLILGDIDGILSDDDDSGRFKQPNKTESTKPKPQLDLRSKLPPKTSPTEAKKEHRQKIVFVEDKKKKEKSPSRRPVVTSSTKTEDTETINKKAVKIKQKADAATAKSRQRITFDYKEAEQENEKKASSFSNRRVVLQRKTNQPKDKSVFSRIEVKMDPTKPNPGIFSRAVRTAIGSDNTRIVIKKEPEVEFDSSSDFDEDELLEDIGYIASVGNLPHGMTDTRLKTLAGNDVQSLNLDKENRSAKITFKTTVAAENFKKKFNNKMVAASRLTVTLR